MALTAVDLLDLSQGELDDLFRASPAGPIPAGEGDGTVIFAPDTVAGDITAKLVHLIAWKGKIFDPEKRRPAQRDQPVRVRRDPGEGVLRHQLVRRRRRRSSSTTARRRWSPSGSATRSGWSLPVSTWVSCSGTTRRS